MIKSKGLHWALRLALITSVACVGMGTSFAAGSSHNVSLTRKIGAYTLNLKLLPAERFTSRSLALRPGNRGDMVYGGGAEPVPPNSPVHPNHHLVVFVKKGGQPLEHATVTMSYRNLEHSKSSIVPVPVTRMWVAGLGPKTTHYGNNVHLAPGRYVIHVVVDHSIKANFHLTVH